jgi:hypothetical protein
MSVIFCSAIRRFIKGFTHSLVHVKHLRDWLDHRIQATLEVGWHWKYGYCDPNEPHYSSGCWGFWRGHSGAAEEAWQDWPIIVV